MRNHRLNLLSGILPILPIIFLLSSCFIDPAEPSIKLRFVNQSNFEIDSLYISSDSLFRDTTLMKNYTSHDLNDEREFHFYNGYFVIKLFFENNKEMISPVIFVKNSSSTYQLIITDHGIRYKKLYGYYVKMALIGFGVLVIVSFIFKTILFLYSFKIKRKGKYIFKYTLLNVIYTSVFIFAGVILVKNSLWLLIATFWYIAYLIDNYLHVKDKNVESYFNSNVIFFTNLYFHSLIFIVLLIFFFLFFLM